MTTEVTAIKRSVLVYTEFAVEYDQANLVVYLVGLTPDGFWDELAVHTDVNNPEEFAEGYAARLRDEKKFVTIQQIEDFAEDEAVTG